MIKLLDFYFIGMSYFPYWNGSLEVLKSNMGDISQQFNKKISIAETAFGDMTDNLGCNGMIFNEALTSTVSFEATKGEQMHYLEVLIQIIKDISHNQGIGFIYGESSRGLIKNYAS